MDRWVVHIDMDAFFASCEQLTRPTLRGRPVLVGGVSGRGVVAGASYEARAFGARSAMPIGTAKQLIGFTAVCIAPRKEVYSAASRRVFGIVTEHASVVEQISIDEAFLEPPHLAGATPGDVIAWAEALRTTIRNETGLTASIGAGSGKQYAKIGSGLAKPDGVYVIPAATQHEQLDHLPVRKLWGIGEVAEAKLKRIGVTTIRDLAELSESDVRVTLGNAVGLSLWELAKGHDTRPVAPRAESKQISAEHTYPKDLITVAQMDAALRRAAEGAHKRLMADGRGARTVTVKLKMADFRTESRSLSLPYATDEWDTLFATAQKIVRYPSDVGPVRLVGVSFSGLDMARQDVLFPELDQKIIHPVFDTDYESGVRSSTAGKQQEELLVTEPAPESRWRATQDVFHPDFGHGWVQGAGHGVVSVRFETRATGPGPMASFADDDPDLQSADPLESLDWQDWFADHRSDTIREVSEE